VFSVFSVFLFVFSSRLLSFLFLTHEQKRLH
jgi:hypothetical protein